MLHFHLSSRQSISALITDNHRCTSLPNFRPIGQCMAESEFNKYSRPVFAGMTAICSRQFLQLSRPNWTKFGRPRSAIDPLNTSTPSFGLFTPKKTGGMSVMSECHFQLEPLTNLWYTFGRVPLGKLGDYVSGKKERRVGLFNIGEHYGYSRNYLRKWKK